MRQLPARITRLIMQLVRDDRGQDLVEYALLTGLIAAGGVLLASQLAGAMEAAYNDSNTASQAAWEPCPPGSGAACK
jgi:Flp pilus assembly pilin Flp